MKIKASWAIFVPILVGSMFLHLYFTFFIGGEEITQALYGGYSLLINSSTEPEMIVILAAVLFVFLLFFFIIDRKTSPECDIIGSVPGGLFLILSALFVGVDASVSLMTGIGGEDFTTATLVMCVFSLIVALLLAIVGMGLLVSFNIARRMRLIMLLPPIWAAVKMFAAFLEHRQEAPSFAMFDVLAWVFLALFLFNSTMVLCGIGIKNPVKSSFLYGLPFVIFAMAYSLTSVKEVLDEMGYFDFTQLIMQMGMVAFALYTLFFLSKLSNEMKVKVKKKRTDDDDDDDDEGEWHVVEEDNTPEAAFGVGSTKYVTAEFEKIRLEKAAQKAKERTGSLPNITGESKAAEEQPETDNSMLSTLDKIDQLIMELSDDDSDAQKKSNKKK